MRRTEGDRTAIEFMAQQISRYPSLRGVQRLLEIYLENSHGDTKGKLVLLHNLISSLLAEKPIYRCSHCGFAAKTLYWNTVKPIHGLEGD